MSTGVADEIYLEELAVLIVLGTLLLCMKLYVCCITSGAFHQAREISARSDTLSQVRSAAPVPHIRLQVAQPTGQNTNIREERYVQVNERNQTLPLKEMHDTASQTYNFPHKFAVINL